jgi:predicted dehydrogenase
MSRPLRFGILGAAKIAPGALVQPAKLGSEATVDVVAARDPERARRFAAEQGIPRVAQRL